MFDVEKAEPKQKASVLPPYYYHLASLFFNYQKTNAPVNLYAAVI